MTLLEVVKEVTNVKDSDVCSTICLDENLKSVKSWIFDNVTASPICTCLSVFEKYQCNHLEIANHQGPIQLNVIQSRTCQMSCGDQKYSNFLSLNFTLDWGQEVNYTGCIEDGMADGLGSGFTEGFQHDWIFIGHWSQGLLSHGSANNLVTGFLYDGAWSQGLFHGYGSIVDGDGNIYSGDYDSGQRSGQGRLDMADGNIYQGGWLDGYMHGNGSYSFYYGDIYHGAYVMDV